MEMLWLGFQEGGSVMYVLLGLSFLSWIVIIERFIVLTLEKQRLQSVMRDGLFASNIQSEHFTLKYVRQEMEALKKEHNPSMQNTWMDGVLNVILNSWQRGFVLLELTASVAPLLGLLGTVVGMVEVFQVISKSGLNDPGVLSMGISKALNTTVMGLIVAMPALVAHTLYERKVEILATGLEKLVWQELRHCVGDSSV